MSVSMYWKLFINPCDYVYMVKTVYRLSMQMDIYDVVTGSAVDRSNYINYLKVQQTNQQEIAAAKWMMINK